MCRADPCPRNHAQQAQLTEAQSSHLHQPPVVGYDHSHLPVPQLHPSLAGLVPQQQQQYQQRPATPPPPPHYQQAAAQVAATANAASGGGQHRDIPVDPVLLGLLPNPPAHFTTSSVRSGGGGGNEGGPAGAGSSEQDRQRQAVAAAAAAAAAAAVAVAGLARGGAPAATDGGGGSKSGSSGGKKRKDKGKEKAKADNNIAVVTADQAPATAAGGADSTSSQQQQQSQPSGSVQEQKESLQDLYSHVTRILGPNHKRHNHNNDPYTGRKVPSGSGSNGNANGTIGAEGVEKAQGGFYEQLRSKWMSTKDLRQLSEQYGELLSGPFRAAQSSDEDD